MTEGDTGHVAECRYYETGNKKDCDCLPEQPIKTGVARGFYRHPINEPHPCNAVNLQKLVDDYEKSPNPNAMKFDQIDGCCDIIEKLLGELVPKTSQVEGCIITHKAWRDNNLKHLRGAFV